MQAIETGMVHLDLLVIRAYAARVTTGKGAAGALCRYLDAGDRAHYT